MYKRQGYGLAYFVQEQLKRKKMAIEGLRVSVSGSGNVSQYAIEKVLELGGKVVTCSDSSGTVVDESGFTREKLDALMDIKNKQYGRVSDYARKFGLRYEAGKTPWGVPVDIVSFRAQAPSQMSALNTCQHGFPRASSGVMPMISAAARLNEVMWNWSSTVNTPSLMESRMVRRSCESWSEAAPA